MHLSRKSNIGVISYCDKIRTFANVNHEFYSEKHGYTYIYDIAPTRHSIFKNKVEKILKYLDLFEWVFWIDDDAFIMQTDKPLEDFIAVNKKYDVIFCKSPVNEGKWTYLSSGNFLIRNTKSTKLFLQKILDTDITAAQDFWDEEKYGLYTNGDQDIMVYLLMTNPKFMHKNFHITLPYEAFNSRPFHFNKKADENFLVHFTGNDKQKQAIEFAEKFQLSSALISKEAYETYSGIFPPVS